MVLVEECMGWDEETEAISQWKAASRPFSASA